jgi:TonB family protein
MNRRKEDMNIERVAKRILVLLLIMTGILTCLNAEGDTLVSLRLYKGIRGEEPEKSSVVASYHLRPIFVGNLVSVEGVEKEKEELKRVFHLDRLKLLTHTQWGWKKRQLKKRFQVVILNGHEFMVMLELLEGGNRFKVKVYERQYERQLNKEKVLMNSEIQLPEKKTAIFGFEDSLKKPYFLSFYRDEDEKVIANEPTEKYYWKRPLIRYQSKPIYPEEAIKKGIQGIVRMDVTINTAGEVIETVLLKGNPILGRSAVEAIKCWKYEPLMVDGKPAKVTFPVMYCFSLPDTAKKKFEPDDFNIIWPTKGYLTDPIGFRIHPLTGRKFYHNGQDIAAKIGAKVVAPADGIVLVAEKREYYGNLLIIDHLNGYTTRYGHLKNFVVKEGESVKTGDLIGYIGMSGRSDSPHLHFELRFSGKPLNPLLFIVD